MEPPNPIQQMLQMFTSMLNPAQSSLARDEMRAAIEKLRNVAQMDPAYERSIGDALRALMQGGPQGGPPGTSRGGQFGPVIGPVESAMSRGSSPY